MGRQVVFVQDLREAGNDDATPILNGGSFALAPGKADTTTIGIVYRPDAFSDLRLSADWYQIELGGAVSILGAQTIVDFCNQYALFCDRITSGPNTGVTFGLPGDGGITFIDARRVNLGSVTVRGLLRPGDVVPDPGEAGRRQLFRGVRLG